MPWSLVNKLEWYKVIIMPMHICGIANTADSLGGVDVILNNNESSNTYFSAKASIFLIAILRVR